MLNLSAALSAALQGDDQRAALARTVGQGRPKAPSRAPSPAPGAPSRTGHPSSARPLVGLGIAMAYCALYRLGAVIYGCGPRR